MVISWYGHFSGKMGKTLVFMFEQCQLSYFTRKSYFNFFILLSLFTLLRAFAISIFLFLSSRQNSHSFCYTFAFNSIVASRIACHLHRPTIESNDQWPAQNGIEHWTPIYPSIRHKRQKDEKNQITRISFAIHCAKRHWKWSNKRMNVHLKMVKRLKLDHFLNCKKMHECFVLSFGLLLSFL